MADVVGQRAATSSAVLPTESLAPALGLDDGDLAARERHAALDDRGVEGRLGAP